MATYATKDDLFLPDTSLSGQLFTLSKFSASYIYDMPVAEHLSLGVGGLGSVFGLPSALKPSYGSSPISYMLFVRAKLI